MKPCPGVNPSFEKATVIKPTCTNTNKKNMRIKNITPKKTTVGNENIGPRILNKLLVYKSKIETGYLMIFRLTLQGFIAK